MNIRLRGFTLASFFSYTFGILSIVVSVPMVIYQSLPSNPYGLPADMILQIDIAILAVFFTIAFALFGIGHSCSKKADEIYMEVRQLTDFHEAFIKDLARASELHSKSINMYMLALLSIVCLIATLIVNFVISTFVGISVAVIFILIGDHYSRMGDNIVNNLKGV